MNGIEIEFLIGLYLLVTAVAEPVRRPNILVVRFIVGLILVVIAVLGIDLLALA